jgi:uncharacterized protein YegP (UPF0339 family)
MIRFTIDLDKDGYRARLWSGSDLIWWTEGYERKSGALNAIRIAKASYTRRSSNVQAGPPSRVEGRPFTERPSVFRKTLLVSGRGDSPTSPLLAKLVAKSPIRSSRAPDTWLQSRLRRRSSAGRALHS